MKITSSNVGKIIILSIILIASLFLNYLEKKEISIKEKTLEQECFIKVPRDNKQLAYSKILNEIQGKEFLKIKKIYNYDLDNKLIYVVLEFKGEITLLNDFIEGIKLKENFHSIDKIELNSYENNYNGALEIKFFGEI